MKLAILKGDKPGLWLAGQLRRGGAGEIEETEGVFHSSGMPDVLLAGSNMLSGLSEAVSSEETVIVAVRSPEERQPLSSGFHAELVVDQKTLSYDFPYSAPSEKAVRAIQHISICLRRAGLTPTGGSRISLYAGRSAPAGNGGKSWAEMLTPACEMGLPCDDCGRCH